MMSTFPTASPKPCCMPLRSCPICKVPARTSSFFFKGQDKDVREIAVQLGVAYVLEGSVQRAGNKLRIVAQLIDAEDRLPSLVGDLRP